MFPAWLPVSFIRFIITILLGKFFQPFVSWIKNKQVIQNDTTLHFIRLSLNDSGIYVCDAVNEVGTSQKVFYVTVVEPPKIESSFNNVTIFSNQTLDIECLASGTPVPKIHWTFDQVSVEAGSKLTLNSQMSSGVYTCIAESSEGKVQKSFHLLTVNKPSLLQNYQEIRQEVKLRESDDDLELFCPFENFNEITWRFNNGSIGNFKHEQIGNKLKIFKIDQFVNGEWKCFVSNLAGSDSLSFNVTVLASPIIHASWNLNNRISEFLFTDSDIDERTFKVGETLILNCTAKGHPKPKVFWKKATDVISEGETLMIENLQFHHSDIYTCGAENAEGSVKKFFKIDVIAAPFVEKSLEIEKIYHKAIGDEVTLRCRISGNPVPNIFWFKDK